MENAGTPHEPGRLPLWRRLHVQLFAAQVLVLLPLFAGIGWAVQARVERQLGDAMRAELRDAAELAAVALGPGVAGEEPLEDLAAQIAARTSLRVTLVRADGQVLVDTARPHGAATLDNHGDRPEIVAALRDGVGSDIRISDTTGTRYLYAAVEVASGEPRHVVRVALPYGELLGRIGAARRELVVLLGFATFAAAALSWFVARRATTPIDGLRAVALAMGRGQFDVPIPPDPGGELQALSQTLRYLRDQLGDKLRQLEDEKRLLVTMLGAMSEGVMVVDAAGRVVLCNPPMLRLLGSDLALTTHQAEGRLLLEVTRHPQLHDRVEEALTRGLAAREEIESLRGSRRHLALSVAPLRDEDDGAIRGAVVVLYDMTQVRQLERVRQDFVVNVSHELRTPVAAIRGWAETLTMADLDIPEFVREQLVTILRHSVRLGALVDDLLVLSRLEARGIEEGFVACDVADEVREVVAALQELAAQRQIEVAVELPEEGLPTYSEPRALEYVVRNLVENAIKYTPEGGTVTVAASQGADGELTIRVRDTGIGIEDRQLPRIFERFYRIDKGRSRDVGGTGLGLSIVKHYAEALGGRVTVSSEVGVGSEFCVVLPRRSEADERRSGGGAA